MDGHATEDDMAVHPDDRSTKIMRVGFVGIAATTILFRFESPTQILNFVCFASTISLVVFVYFAQQRKTFFTLLIVSADLLLIIGNSSPPVLPNSLTVCGALLVIAYIVARGSTLATRSVSPNRYQALCDTVGQIVMNHDADGDVLSVDGDTLGLLGTEPATLRRERFYDHIHDSDRLGFQRAFDSARRGDQTASITVRFRPGESRKSIEGSEEPIYRWVEIRFRRILENGRGSRNPDAAIVVSATRIASDSKDADRKRESACAETLIAASLKDRLLANVSHELRTPLNAILGFSEILSNPELSPADESKRIEYARIIHSSAAHLLSVVNLVLDMSKIEAGKFEIAPEPFELGPLINDCCDMLRLKAESGKVTLAKSPATEVNEIFADKRACRQILLNLMSNAVKFTAAGGNVTVGAYLVDASVHVFVLDSGIGIASEDLPRLGSPFFQVRSSYDRSFEGAGLGLSLVRGLVGLHGGSILIESAVGVGTRVTVKLPLDCQDAARVGGTAEMETVALASIDSIPKFPTVESEIKPYVEAERKIA
jgi:cell cycle sensor histidine kinase DivJ